MPEPTPSDFRDLQYRFAAHLRDPDAHAPPEGLEDRRLAIYRGLFFNNVVSLLAGNFPVLRSLHNDETWRTLVRRWYATHQAHTPLFPELGREFVRWLETRSEHGQGDPAWFAELAHYEWMEVVASNDENDIEAIAHDPDGDPFENMPVLSPLAWPLVYRFPVHRIRADAQPDDLPPEMPTCLIIVRDRQDRVGFLEANPLTLHLIERLRMGDSSTGRDVLLALANELGVDASTLTGPGRDILRRLRERDIILGTR